MFLPQLPTGDFALENRGIYGIDRSTPPFYPWERNESVVPERNELRVPPQEWPDQKWAELYHHHLLL